MNVSSTIIRFLHYNLDTYIPDIWIDYTSKVARGDPLTKNLVSKLDPNAEIIGLEIIELSKLNKGNLKKMSPKIRDLL